MFWGGGKEDAKKMNSWEERPFRGQPKKTKKDLNGVALKSEKRSGGTNSDKRTNQRGKRHRKRRPVRRRVAWGGEEETRKQNRGFFAGYKNDVHRGCELQSHKNHSCRCTVREREKKRKPFLLSNM